MVNWSLLSSLSSSIIIKVLGNAIKTYEVANPGVARSRIAHQSPSCQCVNLWIRSLMSLHVYIFTSCYLYLGKPGDQVLAVWVIRPEFVLWTSLGPRHLNLRSTPQKFTFISIICKEPIHLQFHFHWSHIHFSFIFTLTGLQFGAPLNLKTVTLYMRTHKWNLTLVCCFKPFEITKPASLSFTLRWNFDSFCLLYYFILLICKPSTINMKYPHNIIISIKTFLSRSAKGPQP